MFWLAPVKTHAAIWGDPAVDATWMRAHTSTMPSSENGAGGTPPGEKFAMPPVVPVLFRPLPPRYAAAACDVHPMRLVADSASRMPTDVYVASSRPHPMSAHTGATDPPECVIDTSTRAGASPGIVAVNVAGSVRAPTVIVWRAPRASGPTGTLKSTRIIRDDVNNSHSYVRL